MTSSRRQFLTHLGFGITALSYQSNSRPILGLSNNNLQKKHFSWSDIRESFPITQQNIIHLNSGSAGVMPQPVLDKLFDYIQQMNTMPPYEVWKIWEKQKKLNLSNLAESLGVSNEEISIVRNSTEALNNVLFGLFLKSGDEIIVAKHDYPFVLNAVRQRAVRDGVKLKVLTLNLPEQTDEEIIATYSDAITNRTKVLVLTYITHREGHILPIKKLCDMAHQKGVEVVLDAAHAYGQIEHDISDLGCDYYATSLHKWLCAPHGTGLLFIKKEKINNVYPLLSADRRVVDTMTKFEYLGTRAFHQEIGIGAALEFLDFVGLVRKQNYLHELKLYWTQMVKDIPKVNLHTNLNPEKSCATATFSIDNIPASKIYKVLDSEHNIHTKTVNIGKRGGVRISPNIFNTKKELDKLTKAIETISKKG